MLALFFSAGSSRKMVQSDSNDVKCHDDIVPAGLKGAKQHKHFLHPNELEKSLENRECIIFIFI